MSPYRRPVLVPLIIVINVGVFLMWGSLGDSPFMRDNFLVSWESLAQGRYWTLVTSEFSHNLFIHIFINMFVLNSFGPLLEQVLGRGRFLFFYLLAAVVASLSHSVASAFVLHQPEMPALGASGAIAGLILVFSLIFPREKILLFGIIPLPAIWGALVFVGLDLWGLVAQAEGGGLPIGHGAHLGGAFAGIVYYMFYLRPRLRRPQLSV
jgi:membrane associated rhomboid family serine protease